MNPLPQPAHHRPQHNHVTRLAGLVPTGQREIELGVGGTIAD